MDKLRDWQLRALKMAGVVLPFAVLLVAARFYLVEDTATRVTEWATHLPYGDTTEVQVLPLCAASDSPVWARLAEQKSEIADRARFHLDIVAYLYPRYYMSLTLATALAIVAAFCLLHMTKVGWDDAWPSIKTLFVLAAGCAVFFKVFPQLYQPAQNIADNKALYVQYVALGNELQTYAATHDCAIRQDTLVLYVGQVDGQLDSLNKVPIGFDETSVPDYRALKVLEAPD